MPLLWFVHTEKLRLDKSSIDHDAIAHRLKEDAVSCTITIEMCYTIGVIVAETKWETLQESC